MPLPVGRSRLSVMLVLAGSLVLSSACSDSMTGPAREPALAKAGSGGPTVTSTSPSGARQDTTLDVHVLGSGFDRGSKVEFVRDGVVDPKLHVNATSFRNSGELVANVTVATDAETVPYDVRVTTSTGKKGIGTELFVVEVAFEPLASSSDGSNVHDVGGTGLIVGWISSSCPAGFAPALWDQAAQLTALPVPAGTCGGTSRAVNGAGVAAGTAYVGSSGTSAVRWMPGAGSYTVEPLPSLSNGAEPGPWDINESGAITSGNDAAVWTAATGWQMLTKPSGATSCVATSTNDGGALIARCTIGGQFQGVFWASAAAGPVILPVPSGGASPAPHRINGSGVIAGSVQVAGVSRPARWIPTGSTWSVEILADLGKGGGVLGINDAGQLAGSVNAPSGTGYPRPSYWDANGTLHLLQSKDGVGEAEGISEASPQLAIGGYVRTGKNGGSRIAVRWRP
jgi:hypothetical protein